jgi:predicted PurR-regulated permease PerM
MTAFPEETVNEGRIELIRWGKRFLIVLTILGWLVLLLLLWTIIGRVIGALVMIAIAALLAYAFHPLVKRLQRFLPRGLAIILVFVLVLGSLSLIIFLVARTAISQIIALSHYIQGLLQGKGTATFQPFLDALQDIGISQDDIKSRSQELLVQAENVLKNAIPVLGRTFGVILNVLLVAALSVYILFAGPLVVNWLRYKTPLRFRTNTNFLLDTLKRVVGGYIRGQLLLSTILSAITGIFMGIIGVPFSFFLGILAFTLSFIPTIGALVTGIICVLLALTQGWITALLAFGFLIFLQILEAQILSPRIIGRAVGLHPLVALMALVIGGELFGVLGALFAAPTVGFLQALLLVLWDTWRNRHPEEFHQEDDRHLEEANTRVEQGKAPDTV